MSSSQSERPTWWRIVPRNKARTRDVYMRRFESREDAIQTLALLQRRASFEVVGYTQHGKRVR